MPNVVVVIGAGQIGQAVARRVGVGKHVVLADMRPDNAAAVAEVLGVIHDGPAALRVISAQSYGG